MSYVWVYLHRSYLVMDPPTSGACLEPFASQNFVLRRDTTCAFKNLEPNFFHESPPYLPLYGISLPFQVNLHVPSLKPSK